MQIINFKVYENYAVLTLPDHTIDVIYFNEFSGQVHWRNKIDSVIDTPHPGIYFGQNSDGTNLYMHNHYETDRPAIVTEAAFSKGQRLFLDQGIITNPPLQIIANGLEQVRTGTLYTWHSYNCQSFVNIAKQNVNISETIQQVVGGFAIAGLIMLSISIFSNPQNRR